MKKTILKSALLAIASIGVIAGSAMATPISGAIGFTGFSWDPVAADGTTIVTIDNAMGINFNDLDSDGFNADTIGISGDFLTAGVTGTDNSTMTSFIFNPFATVNPLWTAGAYSFALNTVSIDYQSTSFLNLSGTGIISASGFDDTSASWNFSGNQFTWSATSEVPEPATMLLFGTGLAGLAGLRRKKIQQEA